MLLQCNHGPQLLCCVALCFLGSGESWEQTKNPALGLPTPSTLSGSLLDFVYSFSMGPIGVKVIQTPGHLVKAKDRKQGWSVFPTKDILFLISINRSRKKSWSFLFLFRMNKSLIKSSWSKKGFSATCPPNLAWSLEIQSSEPGDSTVYFCASSQSTALKCYFLLMHKFTMDPSQETWFITLEGGSRS